MTRLDAFLLAAVTANSAALLLSAALAWRRRRMARRAATRIARGCDRLGGVDWEATMARLRRASAEAEAEERWAASRLIRMRREARNYPWTYEQEPYASTLTALERDAAAYVAKHFPDEPAPGVVVAVGEGDAQDVEPVQPFGGVAAAAGGDEQDGLECDDLALEGGDARFQGAGHDGLHRRGREGSGESVGESIRAAEDCQ